MTNVFASNCCVECDYWEGEFSKMFVPVTEIFKTSRARNQAYKEFLESLASCESMAAIGRAKAEHIDLFSRLRNEKNEGFDWLGFDYLRELEKAIETQKALIKTTIGEAQCL